jgi:NADPH-dependent curcumin reductase CurA
VVPAKNLRLLDPKGAPISTALGVLGMTGLTAYFGMLEIAVPRKGETAVISAAAGAVGSVAGQLAKMKGCHVVGIVGSQAKARFIVDQLGFDAAINYNTDDTAQAFRKTCPDGIDIYYDNVGGSITDAAVGRIRDHGRIVICGQISTYNQAQPDDLGPRPYGLLLSHSAFMKGFSVYDFTPRHAEALRELTRWVKGKKIKYRENIIDGIENAPQAFIGLFKGENIGKQIVRVNQ